MTNLLSSSGYTVYKLNQIYDTSTVNPWFWDILKIKYHFIRFTHLDRLSLVAHYSDLIAKNGGGNGKTPSDKNPHFC